MITGTLPYGWHLPPARNVVANYLSYNYTDVNRSGPWPPTLAWSTRMIRASPTIDLLEGELPT
jgi:hypothetical protein